MTNTHRLLIKVLAVANILVYIGAAWLVWYVWPVLTELPTEAAPSKYIFPVEAPTELAELERNEPNDEELILPLPSRTSEPVAQPPPTQRPASAGAVLTPTPTPPTFLWPSPHADGPVAAIAGGWGVPTPMPVVSLSPQQVNILFMGADYRQGQSHWRTDSLIVVTVDPLKERIRMLSIPRDLWVYIPGYGHERINTVDFLGERMGVNNGHADLLRQVIELNLGIPIHYHVRVNFDGFEKIINTLGGVTVQVDCPLEETFRDRRSPTGWSRFAIQPGIHHMDGRTALLYARSRKTTSDFDRARRQQAIMKGVWQGALAADVISDGPRLYTILKDSVETDLSLQDMLALGYVGIRVRPSGIRSYFIDHTMVQSWTTPAGAAVLLPIPSRIAETVSKMFSTDDVADQTQQRVDQESTKIMVLDGIGNPELANLLASQLRWKGLKVVKVQPADRTDYVRSVIIDNGTRKKAQSLNMLCALLGVQPDAVQSGREANSNVDFVVIMGRNYDPCQVH
jgi:LCP family protein required for cell wall assembly